MARQLPATHSLTWMYCTVGGKRFADAVCKESHENWSLCSGVATCSGCIATARSRLSPRLGVFSPHDAVNQLPEQFAPSALLIKNVMQRSLASTSIGHQSIGAENTYTKTVALSLGLGYHRCHPRQPCTNSSRRMHSSFHCYHRCQCHLQLRKLHTTQGDNSIPRSPSTNQEG